ncbi:MAG TPA: DUF4347 domain-containing protein, partial [Allocoleopsis sp.]
MSNSSNSTPNTIAIIDASVAEYESLVAGLAPGVEVVVLNPTQDGIAQISNALLGRSDVDSIQIFSHGASQSLQLGSTQLSLENLEAYTAQLQQWSSALSANADILLYGCNVASTGTGFV